MFTPGADQADGRAEVGSGPRAVSRALFHLTREEQHVTEVEEKKARKMPNCLHTPLSYLKAYCPCMDALEDLMSSDTAAGISACLSALQQ